VACEDLPSRPSPGGPAGEPAQDQYSPGTPPGDVGNPNNVIPNTGSETMPNTGGPPYLAAGAVLLLAAAVVAGRGVLRR
jgi:hypothetical protein